MQELRGWPTKLELTVKVDKIDKMGIHRVESWQMETDKTGNGKSELMFHVLLTAVVASYYVSLTL